MTMNYFDSASLEVLFAFCKCLKTMTYFVQLLWLTWKSLCSLTHIKFNQISASYYAIIIYVSFPNAKEHPNLERSVSLRFPSNSLLCAFS